MNCRKAKFNLSAYIDGELEAPEEKVLAAHLANCDSCRTELANLRSTVAIIKSLPRLKAPAALKERVRTAVQSRRISYRLHAALAIVTAAALFLVGVVAVLMLETQEPPRVKNGDISAMRDAKTREVETTTSPAEGIIKARGSSVEGSAVPAPQVTSPKLAEELSALKKKESNIKIEEYLLRTGNVAETSGEVNKLLKAYSIISAKEASDPKSFGNAATSKDVPAGEVVVLLVEVDNKKYSELLCKLKKFAIVKDEINEKNALNKSVGKEPRKEAARATKKADKGTAPGHGEGGRCGGAGTGRQSPDTPKPFSRPASRQGRGNIPEEFEDKKDSKPQREDVKWTREDRDNKKSKKKALKLADSGQGARETVILRIIVVDANVSRDRLLEIIRGSVPRKSGSDK